MKVLIPIADKGYGRLLIDFSINYKWPPNTQFRILHVVEPARIALPNIALWSDIETSVNEQRLAAGHMLVKAFVCQLQQKLPDANVEEIVVSGVPRVEIVHVIRSWLPDFVILGAQTKHQPAPWGVGSISCAVLTSAPCSVITVRHHSDAPAAEHEKEFSAATPG